MGALILFTLRRPSSYGDARTVLAQGFASPRKTSAPWRPPLRPGCPVNRNGRLRREHDEYDKTRGHIWVHWLNLPANSCPDLFSIKVFHQRRPACYSA
jgi:hypothetical protein